MWGGEEAQPIMAMTKKQLTKQEREWRAQDDARALAESEVIKADAIRLKEAKVAAARMAEEERDKASAMVRIARMRGKGQVVEGKEKVKSKKVKVSVAKHNVFNRI